MSDEEYSSFIATGGVCALFVDDAWPADKRSLDAFLESDVPGVVIPTSGSAAARLVCGEQVVQGNQQICDFLNRVKS
jgi:hypothetical protein